MTDVVHTIYPYKDEHGFSFNAGEKIEVKERGENGWWRGAVLAINDSTDTEVSEREGWFPSSYVERTDNINTQVKDGVHLPVSPPTSPEPILPPNWKSAKAPNGQTYYYNEVTKDTTWTFPEEISSSPTKSSPATYPKRYTIAQSSNLTKPRKHLNENSLSPTSFERSSPRSNSSASNKTMDSGYNGSVGSPSPTPSRDSLDAKSVGSTGSGGIRKRGKTMALNLTPSRPQFFTYPTIEESKDQLLLNQIDVCFYDYFWDDLGENTGFDIVLGHIQKGKSCCKEFADFFKERASIEDSYARSLAKLAHSFHGNKEKATCGEAWQKLKKGVEEEAKHHLHFSESLLEGLVKTLNEYSERPAFVEKKDSKKIDAVLQDDRKKVAQKFKDLEKQQNAFAERQMKIGLLTKPQDIAKAQRKMAASADELKRSIDDYNEAQRKWIEDMILGLVELEKRESERIQFVQKKLEMYCELRQRVTEQNSEVIKSTLTEVEKVNTVTDRKAFVDGNKTGSIRPVDMKK